MRPEDQIYNFYRIELKQVADTIGKGKVAIFVGINAIGKTYLARQVLSERFRNEFLENQKTYFVSVDLKDKVGLSTNQVLSHWLSQTKKALGLKDELKEVNNFSFYSEMTELIKKLNPNEKMSFVVLDFQNTFGCDESFFQSLIYLSIYSYGKVSYIILSEPQILESKNLGVIRFLEKFENLRKFNFMRAFDAKTMKADIAVQGKLLGMDFKKYRTMLVKHSHGYHGISRTSCHLIKENPKLTDIRKLSKVFAENSSCQFWVKEILDSIPRESARILKEAVGNKTNFQKYPKNIYGKFLIDLTFLKKDGTFRYPLLTPFIKNYSPQDLTSPEVRRIKNSFFVGNDKMKLTKKEFMALDLLYKNKGKPVSSDSLGESIWKDNPDEFSLWAIAQIIRRLRKKLAFYFINPQRIKSVRNEGYVLN
ncbi:MAG: hypothetical protein ACD_50C00034G0002 [uncultured bacterium]|uniref:OmpR/PhoB-type domain-containing protein n=1 Tax=Candidatus Woesebacteria bacterium RIFCSPHIGHO2_12_FULL_41_24 TaxID=1802510 RepID=A0A1F8AU38_9BACT|nr:MAG: hypothetical protein ACD_50C00034G0002 [uncultured bacterium]OGM14192.1 MAG: hypothetical protein A2W15_03935 [Candidatus Woesebacteria bacterium RBG_16_41_13]OGM35653.1 MAG: hypothetical protein A3D84_03780 [Candidatus Woesebacteria bacterium RIFCSPHIGHO2_02_FULL_42_20]OGM55264.1 MAG: hypothetical protein A3E44_03190 [Candidatus Woesebacteria bacterium RIFCSPHIGHO2_12_FULL_41_24]OGM71367.1 MAG: hypothetical protein A3I55_01385 [Candidatus Woesebacteria bacterium RIFCSPLOWO2_02_FULL_42_